MWSFKNYYCAMLLIVNGLAVVIAYDVTCSYNQQGYPYCGSFTITPVTSNNEAANIIGHTSDYVDNSTRSMDFTPNDQINFIPTDLFNKLTGVEFFGTSQSKLTTIITNAFVKCDFLLEIQLNKEPFTILPASFAEQCFRVKRLSLSFNQLSTIDEKALKGMYGLELVILAWNKINCLPPLLFQDNKGIQYIDLKGNFITALHPLLFQDMIQLYAVNLSNNSISYIPDLDLKNTGTSVQNSFFTLNLEDNQIHAINPLFLIHLFNESSNFNYGKPQIAFLPRRIGLTTCVPDDWQNQQNIFVADPYNINEQNWHWQNIAYTNSTSCYSNWTPQMADNSLVTCGTQSTTTTTPTTTTTTVTTTTSEISTEIPVSCTSYRVCRYYLDYLNRYTCVIDGADGSVSAIGGIHSSPFTDANVERVYFVNSQLSRIPNVLFEKFPNLNFLYVRSCGMGVINDHTFNACGNLKFLDASFNDIIHIDETSLRNCTKLETIDLTGNPLDYVSTQLYVYDPSLKTVHFNRNPDFTLA